MAASSLRLGIHIPPTIPPERLRELAQLADRVGLDDLWVWEDSFKQSGIASATAALAWTDQLRVGITLLPVPLRNPALTAMEIATIARMFPGRFVAGIGHGVQAWMGQAGVRVSSPLTLLREQATAIRRLLQGETVTVDGRYVHLDRVRLTWPPPVMPPLMVGGAGPKAVALAAELGDGNLLVNALTDEEVRAVGEAVRSAKSKAGRPDADDPQIIGCEIVVTGPDAQRRLDAELPLWDASPGRGIGVAGDAADIVESARRYASFGITGYGVQPTADEPDLEGLITLLGREVKPELAKGV
ncbi:LLM class flavin-dependent oxidoreductase [Microlunatus sp. Gsoil 973]|jgi:alkanesulfonate monooxygenase SsuD/methylene tetrahydromethanopterin reductase-like flavin-dependent oxidoreductase (luciferase family)|uniref:LLM class flavin-dependent oxidoreductase n=1 Tax=Microlunatus sp. Gsoil 973 TaxID=2672569 RepID=UPI0012B4D081|nr:LLM class flavin-dependent oxidoreductase [Microlunatus sp. Gsoil 973]QGN33519.1 LLM class flavin-dependent oxidoreductase [Microlunatus sp. Gsoil 973]